VCLVSKAYSTNLSTKVTLEEAEQLCGYQLLTQAGNLTKIIAQMKELKKQQRQVTAMHNELAMKQAIKAIPETTNGL
jgi:hypothetical protein